MPTTITIEARVIGRRTPLLGGRRISIEAPEDGACSLRELLTLIVRQEVGAFRERREERRLLRILSPDQIAAAVASGKVEMGGPREGVPDAAPAVDEEAAVTTALQGFADGLYFVFLDNVQQHDLDASVVVHPASSLTFIRLVALVGG